MNQAGDRAQAGQSLPHLPSGPYAPRRWRGGAIQVDAAV
jgi:hypothetical protein